MFTVDKESKKQEQERRIANTIAEQMGGWSRIKVMTGMREAIRLNRDDNRRGGLALRFPNRLRGRPNHVTIELTWADTYRVTFYRVSQRGVMVKQTYRSENVYASQLIELFERETGRALRL